MKLSFAFKAFFVLFLSLCFPFFARAAMTDNMAGYAWSSNVGWISFNCTNDSSCGTSNYGVTKNSDGTLTGYAWSSNIGWIQFGGLAGFPAGAGTTATNAQVVGSSLTGWARALSQGGGWDGWIALSGTGYGVTLSGTTFTGYAWGSTVVGWVSFDVAGANGVKLSGAVSLSASGPDTNTDGMIDFGSQVTLSYTLTSLPVGTTCTITKTSPGGTSSSFTSITASGSQQTSALTQASYTYLIDCQSGGVSVASATTSFVVGSQPPSFIISGSGTQSIQFLGPTGADSSSNTYFIDNGGSSFSSPVSVSVVGVSPALPASTTITYAFNAGAFSANPAPVVITSPYSTGFGFKIHLDRSIGTSTVYTVTLSATGGSVTSTKLIQIQPVGFSPAYEEH